LAQGPNGPGLLQRNLYLFVRMSTTTLEEYVQSLKDWTSIEWKHIQKLKITLLELQKTVHRKAAKQGSNLDTNTRVLRDRLDSIGERMGVTADILHQVMEAEEEEDVSQSSESSEGVNERRRRRRRTRRRRIEHVPSALMVPCHATTTLKQTLRMFSIPHPDRIPIGSSGNFCSLPGTSNEDMIFVPA